MIVDTSALAAILLSEADADEIGDTLTRSLGSLSISSAVFLELGLLADNPTKFCTENDVDMLLAELQIEVVPITEAQARLARVAHTRFGRWSRSPAKLNFGDCFSYALARDRDEPLLFKGDDFGHTDVRSA
ncbi:MAG: type II toxin-antitoxin system VapC family toxin [Sphingomonadaceae bacterium]